MLAHPRAMNNQCGKYGSVPTSHQPNWRMPGRPNAGLGWHIGRKYGEKTVRNNWMRIGLPIARADYPAATPPLKPNISLFRDRPFHGASFTLSNSHLSSNEHTHC